MQVAFWFEVKFGCFYIFDKVEIFLKVLFFFVIYGAGSDDVYLLAESTLPLND